MKPSLNVPSRQDVEVCIKALDIEDQREQDAMRAFYARERKQDRAANVKLVKALAWFAVKVVITLAVVAAVLWMT